LHKTFFIEEQGSGFFEEPKMVLQCHCCKKKPKYFGTFILKCAFNKIIKIPGSENFVTLNI